ncbi:MAG: hypothetical protein WCO17_04915 [Betaproteobacteria bacterium]
MREFKKNTWTMIKRLSLGLALAVPGLYQGHAQAQSIVLNFNGTINPAPCLLRVTSGGATIAGAGGSNTGSMSLKTLEIADISNVNPGNALIGKDATFSVDLRAADGSSSCTSTSYFQVILVAPTANLVDRTLGRPVLVNQATGAQVGLQFSAKLAASLLGYTTLNSLPQVPTDVGITSGTSAQTTLSSVSQSGGKYDFQVTPVRLALPTATITSGSYGGSITIYASFL